MTDKACWYTESWNPSSRRPRGDYTWLTEEEAKRRYETLEGVTIVDAMLIEDGLPRPRWIIGTGESGDVRVQFFDETGSVWRLIDYEMIDGRLWRGSIDDYTYPAGNAQHDVNEAAETTMATVDPDGSGFFAVKDGMTGTNSEVELVNAARDSYWVEVPQFGDWATITAPGPSPHEVAGRQAPLQAS